MQSAKGFIVPAHDYPWGKVNEIRVEYWCSSELYYVTGWEPGPVVTKLLANFLRSIF
jgi:hypothetical protein